MIDSYFGVKNADMRLMRALVLLVIGFLPMSLRAQVVAMGSGDPNNPALTNPSFEDIPRASMPPRGWIDCGFPNESAPDVQPSGAWEVYRPAYHGFTYLGMVTRENDTWESVGQRLNFPLLKDRCYNFSIYLCTSSEYWSAVAPDTVKDRQNLPADLPKKNFNEPIKLRIWGGDGYCDRRQLLAESETVNNTDWKRYSWKIEPERDITHVVLEAFFKTPTLFPYNGNILIDNASGFSMVPCRPDEELVFEPSVRFLQPIEKIDARSNRVKVNAVVRNIKSRSQIEFRVNDAKIDMFDFDAATSQFSTMIVLREGKNNLRLMATNAAGQAMDETQVYIVEGKREPDVLAARAPGSENTPARADVEKREYKILKDLNEGKVSEGQIIRVDKLYFRADSASLHDAESFVVLDELVHFMAANPRISIEIGGHTSGGRANNKINLKYSEDLSRLRARTVALYLLERGVEHNRVKYVGYGPRKPIASNETKEGQQRNQRVEIKILSS